MTASARARPSPLEQPVMNQVDMLFLSQGGPVRAAEARTVDRDRSRSAGRFPSRERSQPHGPAADGRSTACRSPRARTASPAAWTPVAGLGKYWSRHGHSPAARPTRPTARTEPTPGRHRPPGGLVISRLLLLGATGDLAGRFLLPALARLSADGRVPDGLQVVGGAHQDWDDQTFRTHAATRLQQHAGDVPTEVRNALVDRLRYRTVNPEQPDTVAAAVRALDDGGDATDRAAVAVYLALPPALFPAVLGALSGADLPAGSRTAVEKPFGSGLRSAVALNELLSRVTGGDQEAAFRVDHFLGMPKVQALLDLHAPGRSLAHSRNSASIAQVDVLWEETLEIGRASCRERV